MVDRAPSSRWLFLFAAALLLIGAAFLRLYQIDRRMFHADEGVQGYQTWQLLRGDGYSYDPTDKHGPFLYYLAAGVAKVSDWSPTALNGTRLRSVTLLAGLGTLALILGAAARLGRGVALVGAALLATAPLAIIYDTYFVQEAWFCFFTWGLFFAVLRWWGSFSCRDGARGDLDLPMRRSSSSESEPRPAQAPALQNPGIASAILIGALAGLMQVTKETSVLHFAALGVAMVFARPTAQAGFLPKGEARLWPGVLAALLTAVSVYVLFYSSFFTHSAGVLDGVRAYYSYALRAAATVHHQPWYYYFAILWPHSSGGVHWGEPLLLLVALVGVIPAFSARVNVAHRALAVFTLALFFLYSVISYKTPWLLLTPYVGLVLMAGLGVIHIGERLPKRIGHIVVALLGLALFLECAWVDRQALGRYANDERNPYVYQPTSPDLLRLVTVLNALPANWKIAVISPDHAWPLPWYLRDRQSVGYFTTAPASLPGFDFVLLDSRLDTATPPAGGIYGLRPNVFLWPLPQ